MTEPWMLTCDVIFDGKHDRCERSVSSSADKTCFTGIFKITEKRIVTQQAGDAIHTFRGVHILIDDDGIILRVVKAYGLQIDDGPKDRE